MPYIQLSWSAPSWRCAGGNSSAAASWRRQGKGRAGREKYSDSVRSDPHHGPATPLCSSHFCSLRSSSGNTKQIPLTSVWSTRQAVAEEDRQPVHDSFPLSLSLSFSAFLYLSLSSTSVCIFPSIPPTPLRQRRTKGETEEKQYNLLALIFGAHQSMSGLRQGFACPLKELISLWFQPNGSAQWQMLNFPSATLTPISLVLLNLTDFVWTVCLAVWIRLWHGCWCEC